MSKAAVRPVLKWAGGKRKLLTEILDRLPPPVKAPDFFTRQQYFEPFIGGGALFFHLQPQRAILGDVNAELINLYHQLATNVEAVIQALEQHPYEKDHYYAVRATQPETLDLAQRAARMLYLNKSCYNGLYRVNSKGRFNVPFGRHKNPTICDAPALRLAARALQGADLGVRSYKNTVSAAARGDFVYFDPPYEPLSASSNFTSYARDGFTREDQTLLRDCLKSLHNAGVYCMLSNSDTPFTRELYADFKIHEVQAARHVNSNAGRRGAVSELIVTTY